jgi:hypothetical protein
VSTSPTPSSSLFPKRRRRKRFLSFPPSFSFVTAMALPLANVQTSSLLSSHKPLRCAATEGIRKTTLFLFPAYLICLCLFVSLPPVFRLPSSVFRLPSSIFRLPSSVFHLPSSIFHLPSSVFRLPSSIFHLPSSIFHLPSSVFRLPSSVFRLPSSVSVFRLPSSVFRLPSSVFRLPSSVFRLPSSIFRLPSSIFRLPSSVFRLQCINPKNVEPFSASVSRKKSSSLRN